MEAGKWLSAVVREEICRKVRGGSDGGGQRKSFKTRRAAHCVNKQCVPGGLNYLGFGGEANNRY